METAICQPMRFLTVLSPGGKQVKLALSLSRQMVCWVMEAVRLHFLWFFMGNRSKRARFNPLSRSFSFKPLTPARVWLLDSFSWPEADLMKQPPLTGLLIIGLWLADRSIQFDLRWWDDVPEKAMARNHWHPIMSCKRREFKCRGARLQYDELMRNLAECDDE